MAMKTVRSVLRGAMWGLFLALLLAALLLGSSYTSQRRWALLLALAALPVVWKGLPWLARRLSGLGSARAWLVLTVLCLAVKSAWVLWAQVPPEGDYATFWSYAQALAEDTELAAFSSWAKSGVDVMARMMRSSADDSVVSMLPVALEDIDPQATVLREEAAATLNHLLQMLGIIDY